MKPNEHLSEGVEITYGWQPTPEAVGAAKQSEAGTPGGPDPGRRPRAPTLPAKVWSQRSDARCCLVVTRCRARADRVRPEGDRGFESVFLRRRVSDEPVPRRLASIARSPSPRDVPPTCKWPAEKPEARPLSVQSRDVRGTRGTGETRRERSFGRPASERQHATRFEIPQPDPRRSRRPAATGPRHRVTLRGGS